MAGIIDRHHWEASIWNIAAGKMLQKIKAKQTTVLLHFHPDGKSFYTFKPPLLSNWDLATGKKNYQLALGFSNFLSDGNHIIGRKGEDHTIRTIVAGSQKAQDLARFHIPFDKWAGGPCKAVTPDDRYLITQSRDGHLCVWELPRLKDLLEKAEKNKK